jgi:hypothetical protein
MRTAFFTAAGAMAVALATPCPAFEAPRDEIAVTYLGAAVEGPGYKVDAIVPGDGFLRTFTIDTAHGRIQVHGVELARQRVRELQALHRLAQMSDSDVFAKSLGNAALAPVRFGADLIKDPGKTLNRTFSGIGNMFDRIEAGVQQRGSSRDSAAGSLLGTDSARRQFAVELGVDPYTDYAPLAQRLDAIAKAAALGGLSVKAVFVAVPGTGGAVVSSTSTISSVQGTLREKTSAQIVQQVSATLQRLKVPAAGAQKLIANRLYTPADLLVMSNALARLKAGNTPLFVARAAEADTRDVAFFQRRRAELLAARSAELGGIVDFVSVGGFPLNRTRDGTVVALFPLDDVTWTETAARAFTTVIGALRLTGYQGSPVLATTGAVTPMAEEQLKRLGWTVVALE